MNKFLTKSGYIFSLAIFVSQFFFSYQFSEDITCKKIFELVENVGDENLTFWDPADFDVDDKENIYLLDTGNGRIQKFDKNGQFLRSIGRKGKGPGEFNFPNSINLTEDSILIYDPGKLTKDIDMVLVSEEDKEYLLEIYNQYDSVNIPKYKPFIKSLSTDEEN